MKRKVIQLAGKTLVVSLPHQWAKKRNIKKGDEIELRENDNGFQLITEPTEKEEIKETNIELPLTDMFSTRSILGSLYRKGYDQIYIKYNNPQNLKNLRTALDYLLGYEIVDQKEKLCIVKNIVKEADNEFENTLSKIINIIITMQNILAQDTNNYGNLEEINHLRLICWKFRDYSQRLLIKNSKLSELIIPYWTIIWCLEKISNRYAKLYESLRGKKTNQEINNLILQTSEFFIFVKKNLNNKDIKISQQIQDKEEKLKEEYKKIIQKHKTHSDSTGYLYEIIRFIGDMNSSIVMLNH